MDGIVITELHLAARLFQSGIWKFFERNELKLLMTDFCYDDDVQNQGSHFDTTMLVKSGHLTIKGLNEKETEQMGLLYRRYKPKFLCKTVSAIVLAKEMDFILISDDELVRDTVIEDFNLAAYNSEWLYQAIVRQIKLENLVDAVNILRKV